jgi:plasmid stabilization system protein ParE
MSLPVVLSLEAGAEFDEAVDWYEQRAGSGSEFVARVREVLKQIGQTPELHAVIDRDVRRVVLRRFPYSILYRVRFDRVEVIAVFHSRRDPSAWQGRT